VVITVIFIAHACKLYTWTYTLIKVNKGIKMAETEGEQTKRYSFEDMVAKSVEVLEQRPKGTSEAIALTGLGYAVLAYAIAVKQQQSLPGWGT
jgi:hypothetical protein